MNRKIQYQCIKITSISANEFRVAEGNRQKNGDALSLIHFVCGTLLSPGEANRDV